MHLSCLVLSVHSLRQLLYSPCIWNSAYSSTHTHTHTACVTASLLRKQKRNASQSSPLEPPPSSRPPPPRRRRHADEEAKEKMYTLVDHSEVPDTKFKKLQTVVVEEADE